jgi:hypothetical protein
MPPRHDTDTTGVLGRNPLVQAVFHARCSARSAVAEECGVAAGHGARAVAERAPQLPRARAPVETLPTTGRDLCAALGLAQAGGVRAGMKQIFRDAVRDRSRKQIRRAGRGKDAASHERRLWRRYATADHRAGSACLVGIADVRRWTKVTGATDGRGPGRTGRGVAVSRAGEDGKATAQAENEARAPHGGSCRTQRKPKP